MTTRRIFLNKAALFVAGCAFSVQALKVGVFKVPPSSPKWEGVVPWGCEVTHFRLNEMTGKWYKRELDSDRWVEIGEEQFEELGYRLIYFHDRLKLLS